jgi:CRISPR-associated protein Cmr2
MQNEIKRTGVDLLKRRGGRGITVEQKFRSTSHMAALPFLELVRKRRGTGAVHELLEEIRTFLNEEDVDIEDRDGALLYESRLREWVPDESKLKQVKSKLAGILEKYSGRKSEPDTYYALLLADGDNMGAAIEAQISPKSHRSLSQALSSFAVNVVPIVEKHQGTCIYAGGDDVLAYLPLHTVLTCAQELADEFANSMAGFPTSAGITPTLSTGIAVVHHLDPLSDALVLARRTEKAAKQVPGKNALAITISKRSGVDRTIAGPRAVLASRLTEVIGFLRNQEIGKGVAYELQELHRVLGPAAIPAALAQEMKRIVKRKRDLQTRSNIIKEQSDRVSERMSTWIKTGAVTVDGLAREMIVATTFADAQDMAEGSVTQSEEAVA